MPFARCYFASKTEHAAKWRELDLHSKVIKVSGRWIKQVLLDNGDILQTDKGQEFAARCWIEDEEDICASDYLVLYAEPGEHLRGGLVEAGIALKAKIPVIVIGNHPDYGSWQWHPGVRHFATITDFEKYLEDWLKQQMEAHACHRHEYP